LPTNFLPQDFEHLFFGNLQKKVSMCFGRHFLKSNNVGRHFYRVFRTFAKIFSKSKLLGLPASHLQQYCFS